MIQILDCAQGSGDWHRARMGIPTASEFACLLASGKDGGASKTRRTYMLKLAGELLTNEPMESVSTAAMERGKMMEPEARDFYALMYDVEPRQVGFIRNGQKGCSPDALIGDNGILEIKSKAPHLLIEILLKGEFPPEHRAQCQGALWIADREWIDIACYWQNLPLFVKRAHREDGYIATLAGAVNQFNDELAEVVERVRRYGAEKEAA